MNIEKLVVSLAGTSMLLGAPSGLTWLITDRPGFKSVAAGFLVEGVLVPLLTITIAPVFMVFQRIARKKV